MKLFSNAEKTDDLLSSQLQTLLEQYGIYGVATGGLINALADATKNFEQDALAGYLIKVWHDGVEYIRTITSNGPTTIAFNDLEPVENAIVTIGSGLEAEGQIVITCVGDLAGDAGNEVSVVLVHGDTDTGERHAAYDAETKLLTFTIDTNGLGEQQNIGAGDIMPILTADDLDSLFSAPMMDGEGFVAGNLPIGELAALFEGGNDGTSVTAGDSYQISYLSA